MVHCGIPVQTLCCSGLWWRCRAWKLWSRWRFGVVLVEAFSYKWWCKMKLQEMREQRGLWKCDGHLGYQWSCRTTFSQSKMFSSCMWQDPHQSANVELSAQWEQKQRVPPHEDQNTWSVPALAKRKEVFKATWRLLGFHDTKRPGQKKIIE